MQKPFQAILIGVGGFGVEWRLSIYEIGVQIVGIVDPDPIALLEAAKYFNLSKHQCFSGDDDKWASLQADFIIDSSPAKFHLKHFETAVEHGMDVLVVKPMAEKFDEATYMVKRALKMKRKLMIAQQKRFLPGFLKLRELVQLRSLGLLGIVNIDLNVLGTSWKPGLIWRQQMKYPLLLDGSIHHFDLMRWILGCEPHSIFADSFTPPWSEFSGDACLSALIEMENKLHINYRANWSPRGSDLISFFSGWHMEFEHGCVELKEGEVFLNRRSLGVLNSIEMPSLADLNVIVLRYFLSNEITDDAQGLAAESNLRSLAMVDGCLQSIHTGRKIKIEFGESQEIYFHA